MELDGVEILDYLPMTTTIRFDLLLEVFGFTFALGLLVWFSCYGFIHVIGFFNDISE